jgi:hypothetical protein
MLLRSALACAAFLALAACATDQVSANDAARAECTQRQIPPGPELQRCISDVEASLRTARERENAPAPPPRPRPGITPNQ